MGHMRDRDEMDRYREKERVVSASINVPIRDEEISLVINRTAGAVRFWE